MERTYFTTDYQKLENMFFDDLSKENSKYTIDEAINELGIFVKGYKKNEKTRNYWVNFKPFEKPKNGPESFANTIHFGEIEHPESSLYVKGMNTQKSQFIALENAILRYLEVSGMTDKEKNRVIKKIETRKSKIFNN